MRIDNIRRLRRILYGLPLAACAVVCGWMAIVDGLTPTLYIGHWLLILLVPVYLVWVPLVVWITGDDSPPRNDKFPRPRR